MTQQKTLTEFEAYSEWIMEKYNIPGFSLGLAKNGEVFYEKGFGYRDVDCKSALSSDTVFGIGSVTKSFTCVAIMQLQEAGKLNVHDPVNKYLPEYRTSNEEYANRTTIHHFMTHTAGLPPLPSLLKALSKSIQNDPKFEDGSNEGEIGKVAAEASKSDTTSLDTYEELVTYIGSLNCDLLGEPGTEFSYSNDSYALLGEIIERVSGISYEDYIKENILVPTGMKHTVFHLEELVDHQDISSLYNSRKRGEEKIIFESNNPWDAPSMRAAGFLKSTVNDMLKYAEIYRNKGKVGANQLLTPESVEEMTKPHFEWEKGKYYGYGLMIIPDYFGYKLVEHGGSIKGVAAQLNILTELGLTGAAFANLAGVPSSKLLYSAFAEQIGKSIHDKYIELEEVEVLAEDLQQYVGEYASGEGAKFTISVVDGKLDVASEEIEIQGVKSIGEDAFVIASRETEFILRFIKNNQNRVIRAAFGLRQIPKV